MIRFFAFQADEGEGGLGREQTLAREMGRPPWEIAVVPESRSAKALGDSISENLLGLIFDSEFYYDSGCWKRWITALMENGADGKINVPLGNQEPAWRRGQDVPPYFSLRGLQEASRFIGPERWLVREGARPEAYCVAVVPAPILRNLPPDVPLGRLPEYWAARRQAVRVFCEGWLHSFNALRDAGRRDDLLPMCDWHGSVLELGCGKGLMGKNCKESGFNGSWTGIDIDRRSLLEARNHLDLAILADLNAPLPLSKRSGFDRVVCADILEHLPYPWELLSGLHQWIKADALLVGSFPNIGHWSVVEDLFCGRWDETPSGIFCVSHLRFGTKESLQRWFESSGWKIVKWERETYPIPDNWIISRQTVENIGDRESLETLRYRLVARPVD